MRKPCSPCRIITGLISTAADRPISAGNAGMTANVGSTFRPRSKMNSQLLGADAERVEHRRRALRTRTVVAGSSMPTTSGPSADLRCHGLTPSPPLPAARRLETSSKAFANSSAPVMSLILAKLSRMSSMRRVGQDRALALDDRRAAEVAAARREDVAGNLALLGAEVGDHRRDELRLQLLEHRRRHHVLGQAGSRDRGDDVGLDVVLRALELERAGEAEDARSWRTSSWPGRSCRRGRRWTW